MRLLTETEGTNLQETEDVFKLEESAAPGVKGDTGPQGPGFTINATGLLADRGTYDTEAAGFNYATTDTGEIYTRLTATPGVWSDGVPLGMSIVHPVSDYTTLMALADVSGLKVDDQYDMTHIPRHQYWDSTLDPPGWNYKPGDPVTLRLKADSTSTFAPEVKDLARPMDQVKYTRNNSYWNNDDGPQTGVIYERKDPERLDIGSYDWLSSALIVPLYETEPGNGIFGTFDRAPGAARLDVPFFSGGASCVGVDVSGHYAQSVPYPAMPQLAIKADNLYKLTVGKGCDDVIMYYPNGDINDTTIGTCCPLRLWSLTGGITQLTVSNNIIVATAGEGVTIHNMQIYQNCQLVGAFEDCTVYPTWFNGGRINGNYSGVIFGVGAEGPTDHGPELLPVCTFNQPESATVFGDESVPDLANGVLNFNDNSELIGLSAPPTIVPGAVYDFDVYQYAWTSGGYIVNLGGVSVASSSIAPDGVGFRRFTITAETTGVFSVSNTDMIGSFSRWSLRRRI